MILHSKIEGQGNSKKLLIIHGFLGMSDNWKTMAVQFAQQDFEVHSVDLRNHGRSFQSEQFNYTVMADDIKNYCQHYNLNNINIIGHSMGGKTAMLFSCLHPKTINKLVVADIGPKYYPQHHQNILRGINAVDFSTITDRNQVDAILSQYIDEVGTRQFLLKSLYRVTADQFDFRFNRNVLTTNIDEIGKALPQQYQYNNDVLFIKGALSQYILDTDFENIEQQFPKAQLATIANAGHWLHAENPIDFFNSVLSFLN